MRGRIPAPARAPAPGRARTSLSCNQIVEGEAPTASASARTDGSQSSFSVSSQSNLGGREFVSSKVAYRARGRGQAEWLRDGGMAAR